MPIWRRAWGRWVARERGEEGKGGGRRERAGERGGEPAPRPLPSHAAALSSGLQSVSTAPRAACRRTKVLGRSSASAGAERGVRGCGAGRAAPGRVDQLERSVVWRQPPQSGVGSSVEFRGHQFQWQGATPEGKGGWMPRLAPPTRARTSAAAAAAPGRLTSRTTWRAGLSSSGWGGVGGMGCRRERRAASACRARRVLRYMLVV